MKLTFRFKILLIMITSILIPIVILSNYLTDNSEIYYSEFISPNSKRNVSVDFTRIENIIMDLQNDLKVCSNLVSYDPKSIVASLDKLVLNNPITLNAYYGNESGRNLIDSDKIPAVDSRERDWYKNAILTDDVIVSSAYVDVLSNEWVVTLSTSVKKNELRDAVIGVDISISEIIKNVSNQISSSKNRYIVKNKNGEVIYSDSRLNAAEIDMILENRNNDYIIDKYEMNDLDLEISIIYMKIDYFENIDSIGKEMAIMFLLVVSLTIIFAFTSASQMSFPLSKFKEAISNNQTGDLSSISTKGWDHEFVVLFKKLEEYSRGIRLEGEKLSYRIDILSEKNSKLIEKNISLEETYKNLKVIDRRVRKSQEKLDSILSNIRDLIWVLDEKGNIVYINSILEEYLNLSNEEVSGMHISEILENPYSNYSDVFEIISERNYKKIKLQLITSDGKIPVEANTSRVLSTDGKVLSIYGMSRDIRKEKELHYNYNIKIQEQNLIMDLTETASLNLSLSHVTEVIFGKFNNIFGWTIGTIRFLNERNEFELIAQTQTGESYLASKRMQYEDSRLAEVLTKNEIKIVTDTSELSTSDTSYRKVIDEGQAIVFVPFGNHEIGRGVITFTVDKVAVEEKSDMLRSFISTMLIVVERSIVYDKLKKDYIMMIKVLAEAGDDKDSSSIGHSKRVASLSKQIAERMHLEEDEVNEIEICGLLHDIGKIGIKDLLLSSTRKLSEDELLEVENHTVIGRKMLEDIGLSKNILDGIEYHHKNVDLKGYPKQRKLDRLPLFARIVQTADSFDNLKVSGQLETDKKIVQEMKKDIGTKYCPKVMRTLEEIKRT